MTWTFIFRRSNNKDQAYIDITANDAITIKGASLFTDGPTPPRLIMPTRTTKDGDKLAIVKLSASTYAEMETALLAEYKRLGKLV